ncbi:hypothetical protein E8K88_02490 [Lampropedia aestuarii]|uniref:Uncharacterized protein n=1 Tax=Lampropedia aestuarii TaxID=2562762 RepID=A0A4V3YXQ9_9BURK|nr:hypothetical protein E8K88_02490 [Lampropedia aestuarii]
MQSPNKPPCRLTLLALAVSLTACASNSPMPSSDLPTLPPPPSLSTPAPQTSYSESAAANTQRWQKKLMDTQLMQQPAAQPGQ